MSLIQRTLLSPQSFGAGQNLFQSGININLNFGNQPLNGTAQAQRHGKAGKNSKCCKNRKPCKPQGIQQQMKQLMQMMKQLLGALGCGQGGRVGCGCCGRGGAHTVINNFLPGRGAQGAFF